MIDVLATEPLPQVEGAPVVLMVSGGSDSTALLVRAARGMLDMGDGRGERALDRSCLVVLHVNHCLRGAASDGDEAFVRDLAARLGVAFTAVRADVPAHVRAGENLEDAARELRYAAAWDLLCARAAEAGVDGACGRVLVAHTADDRAETFLMRAATGAGLGALAGLRARRGLVVRPLLGETRASLRAYLGEQGVGWREDATNAEDAALRSYVRHRVMPALTERNPRFAHTLACTLDVLAEEDDLLAELADEALGRALAAEADGVVRLSVAALRAEKPPLARRALRVALARAYGPDDAERARLTTSHVERVCDLMERAGGSCSLPLGADARVMGDLLVLAAPRALRGPDAPASLPVPGSCRWDVWELAARTHPVPAGTEARALARSLAATHPDLREGRDFVLVDAAVLGDGPSLEVAAPRPGERLRPFGMAGSKLVADLLYEAGVSRYERARVPVVRTLDGRVVWVGGIRLDARWAYGPQTAVLVELTLQRT